MLPCSQSHWQHLVTTGVEVQWYDENKGMEEQVLQQMSRLPPQVLIFEDKARPPKGVSRLWPDINLQLVVSQLSIRGDAPAGWEAQSRQFHHKELGGVTTWSGFIHTWHRSTAAQPSSFFRPELFVGAPSRFFDLIHKTRPGKRSKPGTTVSVQEAEQVEITSLQRERRRRRLLPSVFGKDATVYRVLGPDEVCSCLDIPAVILKQLNDTTQECVARGLTLPVKVGAAIGTCISVWSKRSFNETEQAIQESSQAGDAQMREQRENLVVQDHAANTIERMGGATPISESTGLAGRMKDYVRMTTVDTSTEKAVKHDKAAVPIELWNDRIRHLLGLTELAPKHLKAFDCLREVMLVRWKRNVRKSWSAWWNRFSNNIKTNEPKWWSLVHQRGKQACCQAMKATLWGWPHGSGVFFWRWPEEYLSDLAIGVPPLWTGMPKQIIERQQGLGDESMIAKIEEKLADVRNKGYVGDGEWLATMNYFAVPKGESDIRMVYDGTKSGLNACLYAPWFPLPDADVLICTLDEEFWCVDNDYGEMFLNFWLHPDLQAYSGMDLTPILGKNKNGELQIEGWRRCPVGQSPSPFNMVQQTRRLKQVMLGNPHDQENVFRWEKVHLNLPGSIEYQPGTPWISKVRKDGVLAADAHDYVDDLRGTGVSAEDAWQVSSRIAKTASFYGVQDAARKRREQTQQPGAWAGVVCGTYPTRPYMAVTQEKWDKTKQEIQRLREEIDGRGTATPVGTITTKVLEQVAGYLNHIGRAYHVMRIYLNGVYASMNSWRPD